MKRPRHQILIVEDEAIIGLALAAELEDAGYQVIDVAPSGEEALEIFKRERVDVVLLDVKLGDGMDGLETLQEIRKTHKPLAIMISGNSDKRTVRQIMQLKADGFFVKPVQPGGLIQYIRMLLKQQE